jgi:succinate dehydrogenase / fumarate reductase cytochrome b subunit
MGHTAIIVTIFIVLHLFDFYIKAKFQKGMVSEVIYNGETYHDLGTLVIERFQIGWVVLVYLVALFGLGFHLFHGFQSAFQTMGLNHPVYTPVIKAIGYTYAVVVTLGFMAIPVFVYFTK